MKPTDSISMYSERRRRLAEAMAAGVAVIPTAPERVRNRDTHFPYRFDSHFYYLSGFPEPDAALVIVAGSTPKSLLFCRSRDEEREIWDGYRYGPEAARERFGFDEAHPIAMQATHPGRNEYEIEAELLHEFRRSGAQFPAYWPIVAGGPNACVLHYVFNNAPLRGGDLLLIDAGCELDGYASDVTRSFPVNGRFSAAQRDTYEVVLAAQLAAIGKVRAGNAWNEPHDAAVRVLAQGMLDLKLLSGTLDEVLEKEAYKRFYMHRTGHWLGLDVHDAGDYKRSGKWRSLAPGMVLTVEPGLYIRAADDVPKPLHNIGIRIEDDVLVTEGGCEVITAEAPKRIEDIEALMRDARARD